MAIALWVGYIILYFILYFLAFPEIVMLILLAISDELPTRGYDTGVGFLETTLTYIHSLLISMSTSGKVIFILVISIIYLILLIVVKYKGIPILLIISSLLSLYVVYLMVLSFKLDMGWNILLMILLSLISIGLKLKTLDNIRGRTDRIKYEYVTVDDYDNLEEDISKDQEETVIFTIQEKNPYKILGVSPEEDIETIRKVYRKLSKIYHPDVSGLKEDDKFKEIAEAMEMIEKEKTETRQ